jgi:glycogen debranching enzyme
MNGLEQTNISINENFPTEESKCVRLTSLNSSDYKDFRTIEFTENFRPDSIVVLQISVLPQIHQSLFNIEQLIDLEHVLYCLSIEEQSDGKGFDIYNIPDYGQLNYAGIYEIIPLLNKIRLKNDIKHSFINNLKQGNWFMDYIVNRLKAHPNTKQVFLFFSLLIK